MNNIIKPASLIIRGLCRFILKYMSRYCLFIRSPGGFLLREHNYSYTLDPVHKPSYWSLRGFLLNEHSYSYPLDPVYKPSYWSLGGFLLREHSYSYPLDPASNATGRLGAFYSLSIAFIPTWLASMPNLS